MQMFSLHVEPAHKSHVEQAGDSVRRVSRRPHSSPAALARPPVLTPNRLGRLGWELWQLDRGGGTADPDVQGQ